MIASEEEIKKEKIERMNQHILVLKNIAELHKSVRRIDSMIELMLTMNEANLEK